MNANKIIKTPEDINSESMSNIIIDIEAPCEFKTDLPDLNIQLKGILKNPETDYQEALDKRLNMICFWFMVIVISLPITIGDLYFGFTDTSCSKKEPDQLTINLKLYLLVCGFMSLSSFFIIFLGTICLVHKDYNYNEKNCLLLYFGSIGTIAIKIFIGIWNILGAVVFWGYICGNGTCDKMFSTYVYVSLIIKLLSTSISYQHNKNK